MIEFKNVSYAHSKGYGVNSLNMVIDEGDFTFLIGPTGSGKTTLMRLIYFDIFPDTGIVKVNGNKSTDVSMRCLLYTSPSPRDATLSRMPSSA